MKKICLSLLCFLLTALAACTSAFPPNTNIPHLTESFEKEVTVSIVDHREFILNGDKEPWFEGIIRGGFGIPMSLERPEPYKEQSFAAYLASLTKGAFEESGGKVNVVEIPMGTDADTSINILSQDKRPALLGIMRKSRYDLGSAPEYEYDFRFIVVGKNGRKFVDKTFANLEIDITPVNNYNIMHNNWNIQYHNLNYMITEIYVQILNNVLNDPEIGTALQELKN
ncbi:MAG: hypothetical protein V7727_19310 [Sneathiella sp.]